MVLLELVDLGRDVNGNGVAAVCGSALVHSLEALTSGVSKCLDAVNSGLCCGCNRLSGYACLACLEDALLGVELLLECVYLVKECVCLGDVLVFAVHEALSFCGLGCDLSLKLSHSLVHV